MPSKSLDGTIRFHKTQVVPEFTGENLISVIEDAYLKSRRPNQFTLKVSFAPSSIGYGNANCPRYWYLAFDGGDFVENTEARNLAMMQSGTDAHARLQRTLAAAEILVADEVELKWSDPPIRGFMDALIRWGDEKVVLEIKTTSQEVFIHKRLTRKPSPNHLIQVLIYMMITGKNKGVVLYENRNDLQLVACEIEMNEKNKKILDEVLEWLREVYSSWEAKELPVRPFRSQTVKICQSCPLNKVCWEERPNGTVKIAKLEVPTP